MLPLQASGIGSVVGGWDRSFIWRDQVFDGSEGYLYSSYAQVWVRLSVVSKATLISVLGDTTVLAHKEPRIS
jgi:hypothetical protein